MDVPMPETLYSYWPLAALVGGLSAIGAVLKVVRGAWDFHYDYFTRRHLKRTIELLPLTDVGSQQYLFLRQVINGEVFKIASGARVGDRDAAALMCLCEHGLLASNQVKRIAPFVRSTADGKITIKIGRIDTAFMVYAAVCAGTVFVYSLWAFARLTYLGAKENSVLPILVGTGFFVGCSFVVRYFLKDVRVYRNAKRIRESLKVNSLSLRAELDKSHQVIDKEAPTQSACDVANSSKYILSSDGEKNPSDEGL